MRHIRRFYVEFVSVPAHRGDVPARLPDLLGPLRGHVFPMKDLPRESVIPVEVYRLWLEDVLVLGPEVAPEE